MEKDIFENFLKDGLCQNVDQMYKCVLEVFTLCKKMVQESHLKLYEKDKELLIKQKLLDAKEEDRVLNENNQNQNLLQKLKELEQENVKLKENLSTPNSKTFRIKLKQMEQKMEKLKENLKKSEDENLKKEVLLASAGESLSTLNDTIQEKKKLLESDSDLKKQNLTLIEESSKLKSTNESLIQLNSDLKKQNLTLIEESSKLKSTNESLIQQIQHVLGVEKEISKLKLLNKSKDLKIKEIEEKIESYKSSVNNSAVREAEAKEKEIEDMKKVLDGAGKIFNDDRKFFREKLKICEQTIKKKEIQIGDLQNTIDEKLETISVLEKQLNSNTTEMNKLFKELVASKANVQKERTVNAENYSKIDTKLRALGEENTKKDDSINKLSLEIGDKDKQMNILTEKVEKLEKEKSDTLRKFDKKKHQLKSIEKKYSEKRKKYRKLEVMVSKYRTAIKTYDIEVRRDSQEKNNEITMKTLKLLMSAFKESSTKATSKEVPKEETVLATSDKIQEIIEVEKQTKKESLPNKGVMLIEKSKKSETSIKGINVQKKLSTEKSFDKKIEIFELDGNRKTHNKSKDELDAHESPSSKMEGTDIKSIDIIKNLNEKIDMMMVEAGSNAKITLDDDVDMNVDESIEKIEEDIEKRISENLYSSILDEVANELIEEEVGNISIGYKIVNDLINENISYVLNVSLKRNDERIEKFYQGVREVVRHKLNQYYENPYNDRFKIESRKHFIELCKMLSMKLQEELLVSYDAFYQSPFYLRIKEDQKLFIENYIDIYFDKIVNEKQN